MKKLILWFKAVFGFNQTEINGFIILSALMLILLVSPTLYSKLHSSKKTNYSIDDEIILQELIAKSVIIEEGKNVNLSSINKKNSYTQKKEYYNKPKHQIIKSDEEQLESGKTERFNYKFIKKINPIELNSADTIALQQIKGIGSKLSARIINYRNKLGGFYSLNQVFEVYGLDSNIIIENKEHFSKLNVTLIKPINLDTSSIKTLIKHPYIDYKMAKVIFNYKQQHGNYKTINDLRKIHLLTEKDIEKIKPYLSIE